MGALPGRLVAAHRAKQAAARGVPLSCLAQLVQALDGKRAMPGSRRSATPAVLGLVEQLTGRELEVLGCWPRARQTRPSPGTRRHPRHGQKHVTHVLGKLGAANRTEAVARARELGLIR